MANVRIPDDAIISEEKLVRYLLAPRRKNDKSGFLAQAGFTSANPDRLEQAIRRQNEYGAFYRVEGVLVGPEGMLLTVTIWIQQTIEDRYRFVTLKPAR